MTPEEKAARIEAMRRALATAEGSDEYKEPKPDE